MKKTIMLFASISYFFMMASNIFAQTAEELIARGDSLVNEFKNEEALKLFQQAEKVKPSNWESLWRISKAYVDIGEHMPSETGDEEDAQLAVYEKALSIADSAVNLAPDRSEPYLRKAIANGRIALFKGVFSVAGVVNQVKDDCEKAIELGTGGNEIQGIAHYVFARTHAKISEKWAPARAVLGLGWADNEIAIEEYNKAMELYPDLIMIYLDYARSLIEEDEYDKAREMLNTALTKPKLDEDDDERITEIKDLLKEIEDE